MFTNFKLFTVLLVIMSLITVSCNNEKSNDYEERRIGAKQTYLALGDSYTIGESVDESSRFPLQLKDSLMSYDIVIDDPVIVAKTGWTTTDLKNGIEQADLQTTYDLVTLLIGVNNQYQGLSIENYRTEFVELLDQSIDFAGGDPEKVIVISIPDWGVTPFAEGRDREQIASEIDAYNKINKEEAEETGVKYVDVTSISREAEEDLTLIAGDGLHPSGKMYALWVAKIVKKARVIFDK